MRQFQTRRVCASGLALALALVLGSVGCGGKGGPDNAAANNRGALLGAELSETISVATIGLEFVAAKIPFVARSGVKVYKITYQTIDAKGQSTTASGAITLPEDVGQPAAMVAYQHGTVVEKTDVPSTGSGEIYVGVAISASQQWVSVLPDYLGLGVSPGLHPYLHAATEASAVVDLLRAAHTFFEQNSVAVPPRLFLMGYSQGGHSTMAALRELEANYSTEFTVTAAAPMSGPYDLSGATAHAILADAPTGLPNPYYVPYLLLAYNSVYQFYPSDSDLFAAPYDRTIPPLFDGQHGGNSINAALPKNVLSALNSTVVAGLASGSEDALENALRENNVYDWQPTTPVRLYYCSGDHDVSPENSRVAYQAMKTKGAPVELVETTGGATKDHGECAIPSLSEGATWFASFP